MKYTITLALLLSSTIPGYGKPIYDEPYPYHKASKVTERQLYPLHGCSWYELLDGVKVVHICDRTDPTWLLRLRDKEGAGTDR